MDIPLADGTLKTITTTPDGGFVSFDEQLPKNAVPVNEEKTRTPKGKMTPQKKIETLILKLEKSDPGFLDYCSVSFGRALKYIEHTDIEFRIFNLNFCFLIKIKRMKLVGRFVVKW